VYKNVAISQEECVALRELLANTNNNLKHLIIWLVGLGNNGLRLLAEGLAVNSSLTSLNLNNNDIGDTGLQALASSLASSGKVRELNLCNNNIGDKGLEALAESLAHNRALRVLSISANTAITETGVRAISRSLQSRKCLLEDLQLDSINIGEEGGKILGDALSINTSLVSLSLMCGENDISIGDDGLKALAVGLSHNSHLKQLNLSGNRAITSVGLRSLKQYLRSSLCALETLSVDFINFGDEGAYALADALGQNKSLKQLLFCDSDITSKGWEAYLKLICDTSSPNSIYLSNHTLCTLCNLGGRWHPHAGSSVRSSMATWLQINRTRNLAAKRKILYSFPDLEMVPLFQWNLKLLPLVKGWFETITSTNDEFTDEFAVSIRSRELSAVYQFIRALSVLVVSSDETRPDSEV